MNLLPYLLCVVFLFEYVQGTGRPLVPNHFKGVNLSSPKKLPEDTIFIDVQGVPHDSLEPKEGNDVVTTENDKPSADTSNSTTTPPSTEGKTDSEKPTEENPKKSDSNALPYVIVFGLGFIALVVLIFFIKMRKTQKSVDL